jgi:hypothetical protein
MRSFFRSIDDHSEHDPSRMALQYADYFFDVESGRVSPPSSSGINSLSLATSGTYDLEWLTKRVQLIGDVTTFTHYAEPPTLIKSYGWEESAHSSTWVDLWAYLRCSNLRELGKWLLDCRPLLEAGYVFYYPEITVSWYRPLEDNIARGNNPLDRNDERSMAELADVLLKNGSIIDQRGGPVRKSKLVYPILRTEIPFIDETALDSFALMALENRDALQHARDSFRGRFLEFESAIGSENLETEILRFSTDLRESIRELDSACRSMKRSSLFASIGASLGTVSATLALTHFISPVTAIIGAGGGGALAFMKALEEAMKRRQDMQDRPFYFLWILENKH